MVDILKHWAIMERCTLEARRVVWHARNAVQEVGGSAITLEHFALGLMAPDVSAAAHFASLPHGGQNLRRDIAALLAGCGIPATRDVPMSKPVLAVMDAAQAEADHQGHARIRSDHLLLAILSTTDSPVAALLHSHGLSAERIRAGTSESDSGFNDS